MSGRDAGAAWSITIRLKHGRAVRAALHRSDSGDVILDRVEAHEGPVPDCYDLLGAPFPSVEHVRRAILSRMQSVARGTLDSVLLSAEAMRAWECVAVDAGTAMAADGIDPRKIPDEIAEQQPDGSLLIYVEVGGHRAELLVPPHHWLWSRRGRQT